ncbi:unnamed protein product [Calypogeia fissa]
MESSGGNYHPPGAQDEPFFDLLQQNAPISVPKSGYSNAPPAAYTAPKKMENSADFNFGGDDVLPSFDFQPIRTTPTPASSSSSAPPSGGSAATAVRIEEGRSGSPPSSYTSYEPMVRRSREPPPTYETPVTTRAHEHEKESFDSATAAAVERTMKKYADNLLRVLEGMTGRLSQLEASTQRLEHLFEKIKNMVADSQAESDGKYRSLESHILEVQRGVQVLRDRQEILEAQSQLAKLQLSAKGESASLHSAPSAPPPPPPSPPSVSEPQSQLVRASSGKALMEAPQRQVAEAPSYYQPQPQLQLQQMASLPAPPPQQPQPPPQQPVQQQPPPQQQHALQQQQQVQPQQPQHPGVQQNEVPHQTLHQQHPPQQQQQLSHPPQHQPQPPHPPPSYSQQPPQQQQQQSPYNQQQQPPPQPPPMPGYGPPPDHPSYGQHPQGPHPGSHHVPMPPSSYPSDLPSYHPAYGPPRSGMPPPPGLPPPPPPSSQQPHQPHNVEMYEPSMGRSGSGQLTLPAPPYLPQGHPPHYEAQGMNPGSGYPGSSSYRVAQPVPSAPSGSGGSGGYPRLPVAQPLPHAMPTSGGGSGPPSGNPSLSTNRVPIDEVIDKVTAMGFSKDQVRAVVRRLTENGQSVDLNIVLDKLMNGDTSQAPPKGWFGRS